MMTSDLHVVVGLGATGFSCVRYLKERGVSVAVTDTRANPPHLATFQKAYPDVPVSVEHGLDADLLAKAATIVLSPGVALHERAIAEQVKRGVPVIGDIELFAQAVHVPVISITGTNAKSTVTTLVGKMMHAAGFNVQVGGNLGVPALELLKQDHHLTNLFVLELSSFQLETTFSLQSRVATVLNITPDHMDRYKNLAAYQAAKHRIYHHCTTAVSNLDDPLTYPASRASHQYYFTLNEPREDDFGLLKKNNTVYLAYANMPLLGVDELPIAGKHYQANALAALAIGHAFGLDFEPMLNVLREFKGLPHRCQLVRERQGVKWYNDSKGTNVGATQAAIEGLGSEIKGKLILIAGGLGKNADFYPLIPVLEKYTRHAVLIGEAAKELAHVIGDHIPVSFAESMNEAVLKAADIAEVEDSVLLSPACASYDMFNNFEHRGQVFTQLVEKL